MGRHHQVAVWGEVFDIGGLGADGGYLSLHSGNLQHAAGVVFQQVALERLPASADPHHHMLVVQHLQQEIEPNHSEMYIYVAGLLAILMKISVINFLKNAKGFVGESLQ